MLSGFLVLLLLYLTQSILCNVSIYAACGRF